MSTNKTWQVYLPCPIRRHPNKEFHTTANDHTRQLRCVMCGIKSAYYCIGCDSSTLGKIQAICCPFQGHDRTCWEKHVNEMETKFIVVE